MTSSQEHICAVSGSASMPPPIGSPPLDPSIRSSGFGGRGMSFCTIWSKILKASASPTNIPPSNFLPSSEILMRLYVPATLSSKMIGLQGMFSQNGSPKLATSIPMSFSLVDISKSVKVLCLPLINCSITTSAIS